MSRSIGRAVIRLSAATVLALGIGFSAGSAEAAPGDQGNAGDSPGRSAEAKGHSDQDLNSPQPASNADFSGNGANTHGPYDSTRDGSPSENGKGDGAAVGKPCAGCVGKADNKNPPGQLPGGSDPNAGYECDRNQGIGKTNPAHTGCKEQPPTTTPPTTGPPPKPPGEQPPAGGEQPKAEQPQVTSGDSLPVTGTDPTFFLAAGLGLIGLGGFLLLALRRFARR